MATTPEKDLLVKEAREYQKLGISFIPAYIHEEDGDVKKPPVSSIRLKDYFFNKMPISEFALHIQRGNGIGIIVGPISGNLVCRDFDKEKGKEEFSKWANNFPSLAKTLPIVKTGNGYHVYFRNRSPLEDYGSCIHLKTNFGEPLGEIRFHSCYTIAPPSFHPKGNYQWLNWPGDFPVIDIQDSGLVPPLEEIKKLKHEPTQAKTKISLITPNHNHGLIFSPFLVPPEEEAKHDRNAFHYLRMTENALARTKDYRNIALNKKAYLFGSFSAQKLISMEIVFNCLSNGSSYSGLDMEEIKTTFRSGFEAGLGQTIAMTPSSFLLPFGSTGVVYKVVGDLLPFDIPRCHKSRFSCKRHTCEVCHVRLTRDWILKCTCGIMFSKNSWSTEVMDKKLWASFSRNLNRKELKFIRVATENYFHCFYENPKGKLAKELASRQVATLLNSIGVRKEPSSCVLLTTSRGFYDENQI